jgi:Cu-processing system ATP-binding protein
MGDTPDSLSQSLDVSHVTIGYSRAEQPVLTDVFFSLHRGSRAALVGPNGCGKSTLLNAIAGRLPFQAGHIRLLGQPIGDLRSRVAAIGADFDLFEYLTARENARFVLAFMRRPWSADAYDRLERRYGMETFSGMPAGTLSRGTRRKIQLITALLIRPALLLADEPLDGLDSASRTHWEEDTAALAVEGCIVLSAVHEQTAYGARTTDVVLEVGNGTVRTGANVGLTTRPRAAAGRVSRPL